MKPLLRLIIEVMPNGRFNVITEAESSLPNTQVPEETLPAVVTLQKSDPEFQQKVQDLKRKGYKWSQRHKNWRLPKSKSAAPNNSNFSNWWGDQKEVSLSKSDPDFESKKEALKEAGATWDGPDKVWVLP